MRALLPPGMSTTVDVEPDEIQINKPAVFLVLGAGATDVSIAGFFNTAPAKLIDPAYIINPRRVSDNLRVEIPLVKPALDVAAMAAAVRAELATELGRIDVATSTRSTLAAGAAMTLTGAYDAAKTAASATALASLATVNQGEHDATQAAIAALPAPTAAETASAVLGAAVEGGATVVQSLRLANAILGGKVSGGQTGIETFRDLADTKDVIVSTNDAAGNRTIVVKNLG